MGRRCVTLWAFARMKTNPGEWMMGHLETGGGDIRGVQLAGGCEHAVVIFDSGTDDWTVGAAGGGDFRGVHLAGYCKHIVSNLFF
jgi:hypothetical protein